MKEAIVFCVAALLILVGHGVSQAQDLTFLGADACSGCHGDGPGGNQFPFWEQTAHAAAFDSASAFIQSTARCLECHTTGWDTEVDNDGADDFVTINMDGSITIDDAAGFKARVNVQCEACHGPASAHQGGAFGDPPVLPPDDPAEAATCGKCHQGEHHPYIEEWNESDHATSHTHPVAFLQDRFRNDRQCAGCHTMQGFIQFVGTTPADTVNMIPDIDPPGEDAKPLVCAACHDPHDAQHPGQLRLAEADLCVKCHNPEDPQPGEDVHHATSEMFAGTGAIRFPGFQYDSLSVHQQIPPSSTRKCVACHVFTTPFDEGDPNDPSDDKPAATGHTFEPRLEGCLQAGCHTDGLVDTGDLIFNHRGRQTLTDSLLAELDALLASATPEDSLSQTFAEALFNFQFVESSGSRGVHNPDYAEDILVNTIAFVEENGFTSVEELPDATVPNNFALHQNYPNPFNPTTTIRFDVAQPGNVKVVVYNAVGQVVSTLVDKHLQARSYEVTFDASGLSSGLYFYKLVAGQTTVTKKMLLLK